jgi:hypothetical protein
MKLLQIPLTVLLAFILGATAFAADVQKLLSDGQTAMIRGDMETAKSKFEMVNQLDPRNVTAIAYLRQIAAQEKNKPTSPQQEKALSQLVIPKLEFREATFTAALDFMKRKAAELSGGKAVGKLRRATPARITEYPRNPESAEHPVHRGAALHYGARRG